MKTQSKTILIKIFTSIIHYWFISRKKKGQSKDTKGEKRDAYQLTINKRGSWNRAHSLNPREEGKLRKMEEIEKIYKKVEARF